MCELKFIELRGLSFKTLRNIYETLCEEYRRRLCRQWDIRFDNTWWIGDVVGDELAFDDEWVLEMTEVKYCVDNSVTYEQFDEWWRFCMREAEEGRERPRINFHSWFRFGCRPSHLCNAEGTEGREDAEGTAVSPGDRPADAHKASAEELAAIRVRDMVRIAEIEIPPMGIYGDKESGDERGEQTVV